MIKREITDDELEELEDAIALKNISTCRPASMRRPGMAYLEGCLGKGSELKLYEDRAGICKKDSPERSCPFVSLRDLSGYAWALSSVSVVLEPQARRRQGDDEGDDAGHLR